MILDLILNKGLSPYAQKCYIIVSISYSIHISLVSHPAGDVRVGETDFLRHEA